ncbi:hypothetical protein [Serinibacter salmoneus]|uniref:Uncharacterized protein n=1 Tax=Serinibacter salmoneus TaxID=556530 RepID=A0A2A9D0D2_9MICO|nr:hypothetical protein [Serinibacter salmoneus]PFG19836.1 hypothetical protein ATL40_1411 [Serinibacter salmoneus]
MPIFTRRTPRSTPSEAARSALAGQRPLAHARLRDEGEAVATTSQLLILSGEDLHRLPWERIDSARADAEAGAVVVRTIDGEDVPLALADPANAIAVVIRERVEASIVHARERAAGPGLTVRVAIRRAADGSLSSQTSIVGGATTPRALAVAAELERETRESVGLPD